MKNFICFTAVLFFFFPIWQIQKASECLDVESVQSLSLVVIFILYFTFNIITFGYNRERKLFETRRGSAFLSKVYELWVPLSHKFEQPPY